MALIAFIFIGTAVFLFNASKFDLQMKILLSGAIALTVVNCGVLFEQRAWVKWSEWLRILTYPLALSLITVINDLPVTFHFVAATYFIISSVWFYSIQRKYEHLQMA